MIYFYLFKEFFKIGILSFGGGYATLPFLYHISDKYHWYSINELTQMLAIASITPGPVGINMATYAGMKTHGIITAILATFAIILPSLFLVIAISKLLRKFSDNFYVRSAIYGLKPASCALISAVAIKLIKSSVTNIYGLIIFLPLLFMFISSKKHSPVFYLVISGLAGLVLNILFKIQ